MNFLLYRCAELTIEKGFSHFAIQENLSFVHLTVNDPETVAPGESRESMSGGVRVIAKPDLGNYTISENYKAIYIILMFNNSTPDYYKYEYQRQDASSIVNKLVSQIK